jgi:hypothetical protein
MASAPIVGVRLMENENITTSEITAVTTVNTASQTVVELYIKIVDSGEKFYFRPLLLNGTGVAMHGSATLLSALPTGTQTASVYDTVDAAQLPAATSSALGAVKTSTGITNASGTISVSYGTASGTACQGNDSRLSDARTPTNHNLVDTTKHPVSGLTTGQVLTATGATTYAFQALPTSSASVLGLVKTSTGITNSSGAISVAYGTTSTTACVGNDSRLSDARTPTNHNLVDTTKHPVSGLTTGQVLTATSATAYAFQELPTSSSSVLGLVKTSTGITNSSGTISVAYGTTAGTACQGNDSRLSDARTPVSHASTATTYGVGSTTNYGHLKLGTTAGTACDGADARLSNARTPTAHASSHASGGGDALSGTLAVSITGNAATATNLATNTGADANTLTQSGVYQCTSNIPIDYGVAKAIVFNGYVSATEWTQLAISVSSNNAWVRSYNTVWSKLQLDNVTNNPAGVLYEQSLEFINNGYNYTNYIWYTSNAPVGKQVYVEFDITGSGVNCNMEYFPSAGGTHTPLVTIISNKAGKNTYRTASPVTIPNNVCFYFSAGGPAGESYFNTARIIAV